MKLAVCIVHNRDKGRVTQELLKAGFKFTVIGSTGGFLQEGNTTMLIGVETEEMDNLKEIIQANCQTREQLVSAMPFEAGPQAAFLAAPVKVPVGGAVMFVLNADEFHRF